MNYQIRVTVTEGQEPVGERDLRPQVSFKDAFYWQGRIAELGEKSVCVVLNGEPRQESVVDLALKLLMLRQRIENEQEDELTEGQACMLYDVCQALELSLNLTQSVMGFAAYNKITSPQKVVQR